MSELASVFNPWGVLSSLKASWTQASLSMRRFSDSNLIKSSQARFRVNRWRLTNRSNNNKKKVSQQLFVTARTKSALYSHSDNSRSWEGSAICKVMTIPFRSTAFLKWFWHRHRKAHLSKIFLWCSTTSKRQARKVTVLCFWTQMPDKKWNWLPTQTNCSKTESVVQTQGVWQTLTYLSMSIHSNRQKLQLTTRLLQASPPITSKGFPACEVILKTSDIATRSSYPHLYNGANSL